MSLGGNAFAVLRASLGVTLESLFPRRRALREIRATWGKPGSKDAWLADRYFELTKDNDNAGHVDERTWVDLEFPRIFSLLDTTITRLGSQCLLRQMRTCVREPAEAEALLQSFQALRSDSALRENIQLILVSLNADSAARVVEVLYGPRVEGPNHPRLIIGWSVFCVGLVGAMAASVVPLALAVPVLAVNVAIAARTASRRYALIEAFRGLYGLVSIAARLGRIRTVAPVPQIAALAAGRAARNRLRRAMGWQQLLDLPLGLGMWLNLVFPVEVLACIHAVKRMDAVGETLRSLYEGVGTLDAAIAVASFLERVEPHCPALSASEAMIEIQGGYHPLIARPVVNSLLLKGRSALISGSNMAGKTTFIKMIGINLILGRTLGFCLAKQARIPRASVAACIRSEQSVESGKSRYFAEIETILTYLRHDADEGPLVVLIDEPFSGTNTTERVAAAKAVLGALSRQSLVLATTHDVELQELLARRFDMFHFTEDPDIAGYFDYRLRSGPCYERNALRLLASVGFPPGVIEEAERLAATRAGSIGPSRV